ncbi:MAG TPA: hypothetical protein VGI03_00055 [Verrucomicrobiae bacterium]|jgi:hypothetical protein
MKRWAIYTVLIYALALIFLTAPVFFIAFANWGLKPDNDDRRALLDIYSSLGYWIWLAVLLAGQALLLLVPIDIAEKRLPARRKLKIPIIVTAFFLANLFLAGIFSILCAIFTDGAFGIFNYFDPSALLGYQDGSNGPGIAGFILEPLFVWIIWAMIFRKYSGSDSPDALLKRAMRWLLRGSILELIVAVPSHVIVRRRDDCCAPVGTFWGIATGISVMLLCFGPGVYFLFVERCNRLKPKPAGEDKPGSN